MDYKKLADAAKAINELMDEMLEDEEDILEILEEYEVKRYLGKKLTETELDRKEALNNMLRKVRNDIDALCQIDDMLSELN